MIVNVYWSSYKRTVRLFRL